jgi:hypothetical protein
MVREKQRVRGRKGCEEENTMKSAQKGTNNKRKNNKKK